MGRVKSLLVVSTVVLVLSMMLFSPIVDAQRITAGGGGGGGGTSPVPPGIYWVRGSPASAAICENVTFEQDSYPGNSNSVSSHWSVNGAVGVWISSNEFQFSYAGDYTVTFTISSSYGSASASFTEVINDNLSQLTFVQYGNTNSVSKVMEQFTIPNTNYIPGGYSSYVYNTPIEGMLMFVGIDGTQGFPLFPAPISTSGSPYDPQAYAAAESYMFTSGIAIIYNNSNSAPFIFGFAGLNSLAFSGSTMMSSFNQYWNGIGLSPGDNVVITTISQPDPNASGVILLKGFVNDTTRGTTYYAESGVYNSDFPGNSAVWGISPAFSSMNFVTGGYGAVTAGGDISISLGAESLPLVMPQLAGGLSFNSVSSNIGSLSGSNTNVYGMGVNVFVTTSNILAQQINPPSMSTGGYSVSEFDLA